MVLETLLPNKFRKDGTPTNPSFTPEQKAQLESLCDGILQKEDFGRNDFNAFTQLMIYLVANPDRLSFEFARLYDKEKDVAVDFNKGSITVRGSPNPTGKPGVYSGNLFQWLSYRPQKITHTWYGTTKYEDGQPVLITDRINVSAEVPKPIPHPLYFKIGSEANPKVDHIREQLVISDKDVQSICAQVYQLYLNNKTQVAAKELSTV